MFSVEPTGPACNLPQLFAVKNIFIYPIRLFHDMFCFATIGMKTIFAFHLLADSPIYEHHAFTVKWHLLFGCSNSFTTYFVFAPGCENGEKEIIFTLARQPYIFLDFCKWLLKGKMISYLKYKRFTSFYISFQPHGNLLGKKELIIWLSGQQLWKAFPLWKPFS